ncbi:conserved hypothetical protein [Desulfamplus magnetovallimortis]|uniref:Uncharacterized protein n=1 Tax=Desulfamplus magnetovallimortis TaxID=1246637 RepID=A0A1W1HAV7_9BACT|nr:hypothetical protein [Desulfamplus magnetovallimortis]SLM29525.1 conserved hypothetical protein [Desulfamplus magnetovallimortis]
MLDIAVSYDKYKFLGNEFLTWLWYLIETDVNIKDMTQIECNTLVLETGNCIGLENSLGDDAVEKISIRGDDAGLEEGRTALKKGGVVTDINLVLRMDENEWRFSIKGESMNITSLKVPSTEKIEEKDEIEGAVLERIYLINTVFEVIDTLFKTFIKKRISDEWKTVDLPAIRTWASL